jgi:hypothetical protein
VVGLLAGLVVYARTRVVPISEKVRGSERAGVRSTSSALRHTA